MALIDRLARAAVCAAARRWPAEMADDLRAGWLAELATLTGARSKVAFAGSLAVSPAVDEPSWTERAAGAGQRLAVAAGVTLAAATAANAARAAGGFGPVVLAVAAVVLAAAGTRVRVPVVLVGAALFAFLWMGNATPVMPFMGAADIAPAILVWTVGTAVARRRGGAAAGMVTLGLATAAGSWHAAAVLQVPAWTAPAWLPLSLLPGGLVSFGPGFADGAAAFGPLRASGPAFHASDILLANAAVTAGPMLLCTAFLLASTFRGRSAAGHRRLFPAAGRWWARSTRGGDRKRLMTGLAAALAALAAAPLLPVAGPADATLARMLDNATVFGFGFAAHPVGQGAMALLAAVLTMRVVRMHDKTV